MHGQIPILQKSLKKGTDIQYQSYIRKKIIKQNIYHVGTYMLEIRTWNNMLRSIIRNDLQRREYPKSLKTFCGDCFAGQCPAYLLV